MTYGQIKFQMKKMFPGVDLDLIELWINQRYDEILGELPWTRLNVESVLVTAAPFSDGTVAVAQGSNSLTLTGSAWSSRMSGRAFRIAGQSEYYQFTYADDTTATLDRPYEGPNSAAAGYSIFQAVYVLPADCRMLDDNAFSPLKRMDRSQLNQSDPWRVQSGKPGIFCSYMDDASTPPRLQVELYPVPDSAVGLPFTYQSDGGDLSAAATILQVWIQSTALVSGVEAKIRRHLKDLAGSQLAAAEAKAALANMRTSNAQGMAPAQMKMDGYLTSHRRGRWTR